MNEIGIVVIGYNRSDSIMRLLNRLNDCYYFDDSVKLIVSLDNCGTTEVEESVREFLWNHGEKYVHTYPKRLGLRKHILTCGDFIDKYDLDAIVVFEDDVYPSLGFFNYAKQTVEKYQTNQSIAGISLYGHKWNIHADLPFSPRNNGQYDTFFLKVAQSWGQIWMKEQWKEFIEWYHLHEEFAPSDDVPQIYSLWPKSSWLKYHNQYCIETGKYFVYPFKALSTCFADAGEHALNNSSLFQIEFEEDYGKHYRMPDLDDSACVYDAYFESEELKFILENELKDEVCIDLYGKKIKKNGRYIVSTATLPYKKIKSFGLDLRPIEMNVICGIEGDAISIYDSSISEHANAEKQKEFMNWLYHQKQIPSWGIVSNIIQYKVKYKLYMLKKKIRAIKRR